MRRKNVCRFRNLPIEFDEIVEELLGELGNDKNLTPVSSFTNCSEFDHRACAKFGCALDPGAGLGGAMPFQEQRTSR